MRVCDLLVIGAGPAGCALAIAARQHGLTVTLLEQGRTLRRSPGETLHPGVEPLLEKLGLREKVLDAGYHRHGGIWIKWDGPRRLEPYGADSEGPWRGFQAERRSLSSIFEGAALVLGAEIVRPVRPTNVVLDKGRVNGVALSDGAVLTARWTVDATGRRSWLAQALGLRASFHSPPLCATFGWSIESRPALDGLPEIVASDDGWHWIAPLGNGEVAWARLHARALRQEPAPGIDVTWRVHPAMAGPGYFLVGDAAAVMDPASSHGVLRAIMSGMLCAEIIAAERNGTITEGATADAYGGWMRAQFAHDCVALKKLYRQHPSKEFAALFAD